MGNTLFSQQKPQEKIPDAVVKKAKKLFSATYLGVDSNVSSVCTHNENGEAHIQVGVAEIDKSSLPSHFRYICPDSGRVYSVPVKIIGIGKIYAYTTRPGS